MKKAEDVLLELYKSGDLTEDHILKIWFPTDASGTVRSNWVIDNQVQEQLLVEACYKSHTVLISHLLSPTLLDYCDFTTIEEILEVAQDQKLLDVVRFYVDYSICDLNEVLYWTCKQPSLEDDVRLRRIFHLLIENDAVDKAFDKNVCIGAAAKYGNLYAVQALLQFDDVDPSDYRNYALCMASKYGHLHVVERLLKDRRVVPSDDDNRSIRLACKAGHIDVVRLLMDSRLVDPSCNSNVCMQYAVDHAVKTGNSDMVITLLEDGRVSMSNSQIISLLERTEVP
jgi:hypothetical protein